MVSYHRLLGDWVTTQHYEHEYHFFFSSHRFTFLSLFSFLFLPFPICCSALVDGYILGGMVCFVAKVV